MSGTEFMAWALQRHLMLNTDRKIAAALGISRPTAAKLRVHGTDNRTMLLAMAALTERLEPHD